MLPLRVTAAVMSRRGAATLMFRDDCEAAMVERMSRPFTLQRSSALSSRYEGKGDRDARMLALGFDAIWRYQPWIQLRRQVEPGQFWV